MGSKRPGPRHQQDLPGPGLWAEAAGASDVTRGFEDRILEPQAAPAGAGDMKRFVGDMMMI